MFQSSESYPHAAKEESRMKLVIARNAVVRVFAFATAVFILSPQTQSQQASLGEWPIQLFQHTVSSLLPPHQYAHYAVRVEDGHFDHYRDCHGPKGIPRRSRCAGSEIFR